MLRRRATGGGLNEYFGQQLCRHRRRGGKISTMATRVHPLAIVPQPPMPGCLLPRAATGRTTKSWSQTRWQGQVGHASTTALRQDDIRRRSDGERAHPVLRRDSWPCSQRSLAGGTVGPAVRHRPQTFRERLLSGRSHRPRRAWQLIPEQKADLLVQVQPWAAHPKRERRLGHWLVARAAPRIKSALTSCACIPHPGAANGRNGGFLPFESLGAFVRRCSPGLRTVGRFPQALRGLSWVGCRRSPAPGHRPHSRSTVLTAIGWCLPAPPVRPGSVHWRGGDRAFPAGESSGRSSTHCSLA